MKKALAFALALTMAATMMAGCGKKEKETEAATEAATEAGVEAEETEKTTSGDTYQAALLVPGTLGDKSFWDSSNEGLTKLRDELERMYSTSRLSRWAETPPTWPTMSPLSWTTATAASTM